LKRVRARESEKGRKKSARTREGGDTHIHTQCGTSARAHARTHTHTHTHTHTAREGHLQFARGVALEL
jgi:hypothetical protein